MGVDQEKNGLLYDWSLLNFATLGDRNTDSTASALIRVYLWESVVNFDALGD